MSETLDRRQFTVAAALALLGGAAVTIGCGGGSGNPTAPLPPTHPLATPTPIPPAVLPPGAVAGSVSLNHPLPHTAIITAAQLGAAGALTLDIQGNAFHSHRVNLTGDEVALVARGGRLARESSLETHSNGTTPHSHTVTFN